jgi:carboxypeptidase PM20D1
MTSRKKGLAVGVGLGVGAAAANALRRRWRGRSDQAAAPSSVSASGDDPAASRFLDNLGAAVRIPTVSTIDGVDEALFAEFRALLHRTYPLVHARLALEVFGDHTLLFTWTGSDPEANPFLLMAHQDVVPVEPGTESDWEQPPFSGVVADGFLWGRGTMDDKGSLIGILEAVEALLADGFVPGPTIYVLLGHDEEVGGGRGAAVVAARFGERGRRLGFVLDEGGAVVSGVLDGVPTLALVGVGEKASLDVEISASAEGGHSSMPPAHTAVGRVAAAVTAIEHNPMPPRLRAQRAFLGTVAGVMKGPRAAVLRNLEWTGPLVERILTRSPQTNALIRTTAAVTVIRGGVKSNVLPQEASAIVNFRIIPGDTTAGVLDHVRGLVGEGVRVRAIDFGQTSDPAPLSSTATEGFRVISEAIAETFAGVTVAPWILMGATDSRYFAEISDGVYRFAPFTVAMADLSRVHGTGERLAVADAAAVVGFYRRLILHAGGPS